MITSFMIVGFFLLGLYTGNKVGWAKGYDDGITEMDEIASINRRVGFDKLWTQDPNLHDTFN